jgi:hypothetical protein
MNKEKFYQTVFSIGFVFIAISSISMYIQLRTGIPVANTTLWWCVHFVFLLVSFEIGKSAISKEQGILMTFLFLYLLWNLFSFVRGIFVAETYWDWKGLISNSMAIFLPIVALSANNMYVLKKLLGCYLWLGLPIFIFLSPLFSNGAYGFYLVPISFLALFLPVLSRNARILVLLFSFVVITADLGARSNLIKFIFPLFFSLMFYFRYIITQRLVSFLSKFIFVLPFLFFSLAASNAFNIFKMSDYIQGDFITTKLSADGNVNDENLLSDTRTLLYLEALNTAEYHDSWLIGRSPARGTVSLLFGDNDENGRGERLGNEVAIINIFTWTGLIGVILYAITFFKAANLAINNSNNYFSKILGLYISFRWAYAWVEDINYFTLTTVSLWLIVGLCYSINFREMTNEEVKSWIMSAFLRKYRIIL